MYQRVNKAPATQGDKHKEQIMPRTFNLNNDGILTQRPNHIPQDVWVKYTRHIAQKDSACPIAIRAEDLTFGVEIETHITNDASAQPGSYHGGHTTGNLPAFNDGIGSHRWGAERDSSIQTGRSGRYGAEYISPVLKGERGLRNLMDVVSVLKADTNETLEISHTNDRGEIINETFSGQGARVNRSCGVHVHVGFPTNDLKALQRLVALVASLEEGIYASTGSTRRRNGTYSRPIKDRGERKDAQKMKDTNEFNRVWCNGSYSERYFGLNLVNLIRGRRPAVEFRFFSGSLNPIKIAAWTQMCLGLVQLALSAQRSAPWDSKPASNWYGKDKTQSEREVQRLMQKLGWVYKRDNNTFGTLGILAEGGNAPKRMTMVREMRRLARQYDDQIESGSDELG